MGAQAPSCRRAPRDARAHDRCLQERRPKRHVPARLARAVRRSARVVHALVLVDVRSRSPQRRQPRVRTDRNLRTRRRIRCRSSPRSPRGGGYDQKSSQLLRLKKCSGGDEAAVSNCKMLCTDDNRHKGGV